MNSGIDLEHQYKDTVNLPETDFPMRGNGPIREPEFQKTWFENKIYEQGLELRKKENAALFVLHDGPPYLSSNKIHIGTALNKILKDIVIRYKYQRGYQTPYIPGYDSHGLPIETAVVKEIKGGREAVSVPELRKLCTEFALNNLKGQEEKFKRLGILGDWGHPYITLDPKFEAEQIRLFGQMAGKGYIYRGLKAVYWSYGAQTALADAEVEYNEAHVSQAIYVAFPIEASSIKVPQLDSETRIVIWTTTPWTIPGNLAICLNADIEYVLVKAHRELKEGEIKDFGKLLLAKDLVEAFSKDTGLKTEIVSDPLKGSSLEGLIAIHPLYHRPSPIIFGEHVTIDAGTGCVHTAPGHGQEDFEVGKKYHLEILCPVDGKGIYTEAALAYKFKNPELAQKILASNEKLSKIDLSQTVDFKGFQVIEEGNDLMIAALIDSGALLSKKKITHSYPYCWRSKTPLLYRATEQWFCSIDGFRQKALEAINQVRWIPERGHNRIYSMVEERGDWCISRQRTWGVPIPAIYNLNKLNKQGNPEAILDEELISHIANIFEKEGSSAWYSKGVSELIPESFLKNNPEIDINKIVLEKDTMDVWFDSGSTHRSVVAIRPELSPGGHYRVADLYLEGSDQHRGWFQSSLLTAVATTNEAPYKAVLTHGFVMDEKGRKMSKSVGNVVDPEDVIKTYGADILRLWVASVDYTIDIKVGDSLFKQLSDIYRNFRNTARYMLGALNDFDPIADTVSYQELAKIDQLILHRLQTLIEKLTEAFDNYQFYRYYQLIQNFCSVDLSAFYFDVIKDILYTHPKKSKTRRSVQTTLYELLSSINRLLVPVLPHLAEDIYTHSPAQIKNSYFDNGFFVKDIYRDHSSILLSNWPLPNTEFNNLELANCFEELSVIRELVFKEIETLRQSKLIGKSLEVFVEIQAPSATYTQLNTCIDELAALFIVSKVKLKESDVLKIEARKFEEAHKCPRCWKYFYESELNGELCHSCFDAVAD